LSDGGAGGAIDVEDEATAAEEAAVVVWGSTGGGEAGLDADSADDGSEVAEMAAETAAAAALVPSLIFGDWNQTRCPTALACTESHVYVSDAVLNRVSMFRRDDGSRVRFTQWTDLHSPHGLCVAAGALFACDRGVGHFDGCVVAYSLDLVERLCVFGGRPSGPSGAPRTPPMAPEAIAAHTDACCRTHLFVTDRLKHCLHVWTVRAEMADEACLPFMEATFMRQLGSEGNVLGAFGGPHGVAVLSARNGAPLLVVSEHANERVQVLTLDGSPLQTLHLGAPLGGLSVWGTRVWVTDGENATVYALSLV